MPDPTTDLITTAQAATRLGLSARTVRALIQRGSLPAQRLGRDYAIRADDLALVAVRPPRGRRWPARETPPA